MGLVEVSTRAAGNSETAFRYHLGMTRLLLTFVGVAALQLGTPRTAELGELLRPCADPTSVVARPDAQSKGALPRAGSRTDALQVTDATSCAPAEPPHPLQASAHDTSPTEAPGRLGPASLPRVLQDARAPPA